MNEKRAEMGGYKNKCNDCGCLQNCYPFHYLVRVQRKIRDEKAIENSSKRNELRSIGVNFEGFCYPKITVSDGWKNS